MGYHYYVHKDGSVEQLYPVIDYPWKRNKVMDFEKLAIDIHENAINHGFAEAEVTRPLHEHAALIHSEISEMLEAYRQHHDTSEMIGENGKPEGVPSEAADILIRALDLAAEWSIDLSNVDYHEIRASSRLVKSQPFTLYVAALHSLTSNLTLNEGAYLPALVRYLILFCHDLGIDIEGAVLTKMEYNINRPYKHGNKAL